MMLGAMSLSWLADRHGRRLAVSLTLLAAGLSTCLVYFVLTVAQLIALRVVAGLALGVLVATLPVLAGEFSPARYRTLAVSLLIAAAALGAVVGGYGSAALIAEQGWRSIFLYAGLFTLCIGVLVHLYVPESIAFLLRRPSEHTLVTVNRTLQFIGQHTIAQLPTTHSPEKAEAATVAALLTPPRRLTTLLTWSAFFTGFLVVYFVMSWRPKVLSDAGVSQTQAIKGTSLIPFGSLVGTTLFGRLSRWWPLNRIIAVGCVVGACLILVLSGLLQDVRSLTFFVIAAMSFWIGVSLMGAFSNLYAVASTVYPVQMRSTGIGWAAGLGRAGAVISPTAAGLLLGLNISMPTLFALAAIPALLSARSVGLIRLRELP